MSQVYIHISRSKKRKQVQANHQHNIKYLKTIKVAKSMIQYAYIFAAAPHLKSDALNVAKIMFGEVYSLSLAADTFFLGSVS